MAGVMALWVKDAEGSSRVLESVQQPREPMASVLVYGSVMPVAEVVKTVATLDPPHICEASPEHLVVQVVAAVEGRVLPHVQASDHEHIVAPLDGVTYCQRHRQMPLLFLGTRTGTCLAS